MAIVNTGAEAEFILRVGQQKLNDIGNNLATRHNQWTKTRAMLFDGNESVMHSLIWKEDSEKYLDWTWL